MAASHAAAAHHLAVGVLTHPAHVARRAAVRATWAAASIAGKQIVGTATTLRFVVGASKLQSHVPEMQAHADVV
eukprot:510471-Prymnesium_polylepis.1